MSFVLDLQLRSINHNDSSLIMLTFTFWNLLFGYDYFYFAPTRVIDLEDVKAYARDTRNQGKSLSDERKFTKNVVIPVK